MAQIKKIFMVCGEPSGDLLAGSLAGAIKNLDPAIEISAVGGSNLIKSGAKVFYDIKELAVMGLFDVLKKLPKFFALKKVILNKIRSEKPDAIILTDFSGFNLQLAKAINQKIPVIYYVSPQVWASRENRVKSIKKFISKMIVLFKFEEEFYRKRQIPATCPGHPLVDIVKSNTEKSEFIKNHRLSADQKIIALLPGSRKQEIKMILPVMLKAAAIINQAIPQTQFIIAKAANLQTQLYLNECKKFKLNLHIIDGLTHDCLNHADASLVCSGTATLEAAILQKPFVIIYKANLFNYLLYRPQIKIPYIGMANIVAGKEIVPEFIQFKAQPKLIAAEIIKFLQDPQAATSLSQELLKVKNSLGESGASQRAAQSILAFLSHKNL